tara:strand:+ start:352 stop:606 length:255 start_codon:yes stop_codon:yes gene_type:complete
MRVNWAGFRRINIQFFVIEERIEFLVSMLRRVETSFGHYFKFLLRYHAADTQLQFLLQVNLKVLVTGRVLVGEERALFTIYIVL